MLGLFVTNYSPQRKETNGYTRIKHMVKCAPLHTTNFICSLHEGMLSATASLGLILLWDVESGLTEIDKYLYSPEDYIKVSSCCLMTLIVLILVVGWCTFGLWYCQLWCS